MKKITILFALIAVSIYGAKAQNISQGSTQYNGNIYHLGGNLGIKTNTPMVPLQVNANAYTDNMILGSATGGFSLTGTNGQYGLFSGVSYDGHVWIQVGRNDGNTATYPLTLQSQGGHVGIGTTAPKFKFHIRGGNANSELMTLGTTTTSNFALTSADGGQYGLFAGVGNTGRAWLQVGRYDTNTPYDLTLQAAGGNVGIGTIEPNARLQINTYRPILLGSNGDQGIYGSSIGFNAVINSSSVPNQFTKLGGTIQQGGAAIVVDYSGSMYFQTYNAGTENASTINYNPQVTFFNNGYVGIGTTTPNYKLDVAGSIHLRSLNATLEMGNADNSASYGSIGFNNTTNDVEIKQKYNSGAIRLFTNTTNERLTILENGNVGIGTSNPQSSLNVSRGWSTGLTFQTNSAAIFEQTDYSSPFAVVQILMKTGNANAANSKGLVIKDTWGSDDPSRFAIYQEGGCKNYFEGNVGIGTTNPTAKLAVNGIIKAKEVKVTIEAVDWPDFVFNSNHKLRPLGEVEQFIKANNHLPEIPTETEVKQNGVGLGEMNAKLLQKIEELTLYMIEQQKQMIEQQKVNEQQNRLIEDLVKQIGKTTKK